MKSTFSRTLFLVFACIALAVVSGCVASSGDDQSVATIGHEGFDIVADHISSVNGLSGSALKYKLSKIESSSHEYYGELAPLKPTSTEMKNLQKILLQYFSNAELWSESYQQYMDTGNSADLDKANLYKVKMMDAVRAINNL